MLIETKREGARAQQERGRGRCGSGPSGRGERTAIRAGAIDGTAVHAGPAFGSELDERPACVNQVLLEPALERGELVKVRKGKDPLGPFARGNDDVEVGKAPQPKRDAVAAKHPGWWLLVAVCVQCGLGVVS